MNLKPLAPFLFSITFLTTASAARASAIFALPTFGTWIMTVEEGFDTQSCADDLEAVPGVHVTQVLPFIGALTLEASNAAVPMITSFACVKNIETEKVFGHVVGAVSDHALVTGASN